MQHEIKMMKMWKWYGRIDVLFEIIKQTKNRECAFLVPYWCTDEMKRYSIRMLKIHNVKHLKFVMRASQIFSKKTIVNLYYSLAKYKNGIPNQTMNLYERNNEDWKNKHYEEIESFDFVIDIDAGDFSEFELCYLSAKNIKNYFDFLKVPYSLRFSGKGFHFFINSDYMPKKSFNPYDEDNIYKLHFKIAKSISDRFSEMVDLKIYDSRRVLKIPYTLSIYEKNIYVCYPFQNDDEFNNFKLKNYSVDNFNKEIQNRGIKIFNEEGNILKLLKDLKIEV